MALEVHLVGTPPAEIRRIAALMREQHRTRQRQINSEVRDAMRPFERAVVAAVPEYMPSGYEGTLARAVRVRTQIQRAGIRLRVMAMGKSEQRDVAMLNKGVLAHKLFGRSVSRKGKSLWYRQQVPPGFVDNPARRSANDVYRALDAWAERVRQRVERG